MKTGDSNNAQDVDIYSNIDSIWAWGTIVSNSEQYHGSAAANRGTFNQRIVRVVYKNALASLTMTLAAIASLLIMPIMF